MKAYENAVMNLVNGNQSDFRKWIQGTSKVNMLNAIEYAQQEGLYKRHEIINQMRIILET